MSGKAPFGAFRMLFRAARPALPSLFGDWIIGYLIPYNPTDSDPAVYNQERARWLSDTRCRRSTAKGCSLALLKRPTARICWVPRCAVASGSSVVCYSPVKGYRPLSNLDGGRLVFNPAKALNPDNPIKVPCGNCIGCRITKAQDWAARCYHESQMHQANAFITLTYSDEHLPDDYSLSVRELQLFIKKLRFSLPQKIRFFACGEYGPENLRPHYHSLIFNHDFPDKIFWKTNQRNEKLYTSEKLNKLWGKGFTTIGDVTFESAGYCAEYVMKKINGERAASHYLRTHPVTGSVCQVTPEFCVQSRRPGIGATWYEKFKSDCFPTDFIVVEGRERAVPRYYTNKLQEEELTRIKRRRKASAIPRKPDNTKERLKVREEVKRARRSRLVRTL